MNRNERKVYNRDYDKSHRKTRRQQQYEYRKRVRAWLVDYRASQGCSHCDEGHPACLDFHHRNPEDKKELNFSGLVNHGYGKERLMQEIAKCDILCSNCHRKLHWEERNGALV